MNAPPEIVWSVQEPTAGFSEHTVWTFAVRSRRNEELTRFLDVLEISGGCNVVVFDPDGRETHFPCCLPVRELAVA